MKLSSLVEAAAVLPIASLTQSICSIEMRRVRSMAALKLDYARALKKCVESARAILNKLQEAAGAEQARPEGFANYVARLPKATKMFTHVVLRLEKIETETALNDVVFHTDRLSSILRMKLDYKLIRCLRGAKEISRLKQNLEIAKRCVTRVHRVVYKRTDIAPTSYLRIQSILDGREPLRRRVVSDLLDDYLLLVVNCPLLNEIPAGDIIKTNVSTSIRELSVLLSAERLPGQAWANRFEVENRTMFTGFLSHLAQRNRPGVEGEADVADDEIDVPMEDADVPKSNRWQLNLGCCGI